MANGGTVAAVFVGTFFLLCFLLYALSFISDSKATIMKDDPRYNDSLVWLTDYRNGKFIGKYPGKDYMSTDEYKNNMTAVVEIIQKQIKEIYPDRNPPFIMIVLFASDFLTAKTVGEFKKAYEEKGFLALN